jgi:hypothetical protein
VEAVEDCVMTIREHGESQHTPTPWKLGASWANGRIIGPNDQSVVDLEDDDACGDPECCGAPTYRVVLSEADAAFIVRACNSHAALVAAINDAEIAIREGLIEKARRLMREALARVSP